MAPLQMPLNDLEGYNCYLKPFYLTYLVKHSTNLLTCRVARSLCTVAVPLSFDLQCGVD